MSPADSISVLRDVYLIGLAAAALAILVYSLLRQRAGVLWSYEGNVLTRPYGPVDLIPVVLMLGLVGLNFFITPQAPAGAGGAPVPAPDATSAAAAGLPDFTTLANGLLEQAIFIGFIIVYLAIFRGFLPAELFGLRTLPWKRVILWSVVWIVGVYCVILLVATLRVGPKTADSPQELVKAYRQNADPAFRMLLAFMAAIMAPLSEELVFRGLIYGVMKRFTDRWFAAVFSALMFSVVHGSAAAAPELFLLGLGFALAYEATGSLLVPILMHMLFNAWNLLLMTLATMVPAT